MDKLINKISTALLNSDYSFVASGFRNVKLNELSAIVKIILETKKCDTTVKIELKLKDLYKYHPKTILMDKAQIKINCPDYDEENCNCFYPDTPQEKYYCTILRKKYLEKTDYRNTPEYKTWRTAVFERDGYSCQECSSSKVELNAHHIKTYKKHPKLRFDVNNGITLCTYCHKEKHKKRV